MRMVYLTLGLMVLLNIGANCRTPQITDEKCTPLSSGLVHCAQTQVHPEKLTSRPAATR